MFSWVKSSSFEDFGNRGIFVGEENGNKIYVGRTVTKEGKFVPAKIVPALRSAFYTFNGVEEKSGEVESLDNYTDYDWFKSSKVNFDDAVSVSGSYIGRGFFNGHVVVGTVDTKTNLLVGSCEGKIVNLSSFDVLTRKSSGSGLSSTLTSSQNSSFNRSEFSKSEQFFSSKTNVEKSILNGSYTFQTEKKSYEYKFMNLMNRIQLLESEKALYQRDRESYEERLLFEQRKVVKMTNELKALRIENSQFSRERTEYKEKHSSEKTRIVELETRIRELSLHSSFLTKKITNFEEAIRYEKLLVQSITERFNSSSTYTKTLQTKLTSFEESIRTYQQRIFELEGELMITSSSSESLTKKITDYEETIKFMRLQMETYNKKLEISFNDNEFLVQKLTILTHSLRTYQNQLECLTNKLQSSKTVIATAHSDLSRSNAQISKYQAALSSCYVTNGELMTKVSGLAAVAQNQVGSDCSLNLVNHNSGVSFGSSFKNFGYGNSSAFMGMTGSDSYMSSMSSSEEAQSYVTLQTGESNGFNGHEIPKTNGGSSFEIPA